MKYLLLAAGLLLAGRSWGQQKKSVSIYDLEGQWLVERILTEAPFCDNKVSLIPNASWTIFKTHLGDSWQIIRTEGGLSDEPSDMEEGYQFGKTLRFQSIGEYGTAEEITISPVLKNELAGTFYSYTKQPLCIKRYRIRLYRVTKP